MCGLSEGEEPALQGLTTSLIDRNYHARLFSSLTVVEITAKLVGGPLMGKLFAIGKKHGQGSKGICFSASAVNKRLQPFRSTADRFAGHTLCTVHSSISTEAEAMMLCS